MILFKKVTSEGKEITNNTLYVNPKLVIYVDLNDNGIVRIHFSHETHYIAESILYTVNILQGT